MPTQVQLRRSNSSIMATITGANGELMYDFAEKTVVAHDGVTAGGTYLAKKNSPTFTGVLTITGNVAITGNLAVSNVTNLSNNLIVAGNTQVQQQLMVTNVATFSNNVVINGNLVVTGTTTYVNTATLNVSDNIITLNADHAGSPTLDAGIEINRGAQANVILQWNETTDVWQLTSDGTNYYTLLTNANPTANQLVLTTNTFTLGTSSVGANGFSRLPNGLLYQWGSVVSNNTTEGNITFPTVFTNMWSITCTVETPTYDATYQAQVIASNTSTANVRTANATSRTVRYLAIGN